MGKNDEPKKLRRTSRSRKKHRRRTKSRSFSSSERSRSVHTPARAETRRSRENREGERRSRSRNRRGRKGHIKKARNVRSRTQSRTRPRGTQSRSPSRDIRSRNNLRTPSHARMRTRDSRSRSLSRRTPSGGAQSTHGQSSAREKPDNQVMDHGAAHARVSELSRAEPGAGAASLSTSGAPPSAQRAATSAAESPVGVSTDERGDNSTSDKIALNISDFAILLQNIMRGNGQGIRYDKNIIPDFDPVQRNQRVENWIGKVNECAQIYNWTDEQTRHFALPKLVGHAKKWYEGLNSILLTWPQWQERLVRAFPSETNYGALLAEMLDRKMKSGESVDDYYYDKVTLLNACEIKGKKAVDCLIHGIDDRMIRASASSARLSDPEDLLKFLKDLCREAIPRINKQRGLAATSNNDVICFKCNKHGHRSAQCNLNATRADVICFNCKEKGHISSRCPKPITKCENCHRFGHKTSECLVSKNANNKIVEKKTMLTQTNKPDLKYHKQGVINENIKLECYIDFGSDCTLIRQDVVDQNSLLKIVDDLPKIRGFGNDSYTPIAKTRINLSLGDVSADIDAYVVEPSLLAQPLLVGQNFTERPDVLVIKTNDKLDILKRDISKELTNLSEHDDRNDKVVLRIVSDTVVDSLDYVECVNRDQSSCDFYVDNAYRHQKNNDYTVLGGIYNMCDGSCKIAVYNLSKTPLNLNKGTVLARGETIKSSMSQNNLTCRKIKDSFTLSPFTRDEININPNLSKEQTEQVINLINQYRSCFAQNLTELGCTDLAEMTIELEDTTPVVYRPYRMSYTERDTVRQMVKELMDQDVVEESSSAYASPIILVKKKTGGHRLCVDFRALNRKTKKDHYPIPRIDDQLDLLNGNKYYTSLDLASGYYQIPIHPDCRYLTAFITPDGLYQFKKMPFGLVNSPAVFQRTINRVLGNSRHKSALAYMDDILIPGKTFEIEMARLEEAFKLLQEAGFTLNLQKCHFFKEELEYLGHEISESGIRPGKAKILAVEQFPKPRNVHEIRQFIGLASYFRKYIKDFATIARPLTDLTRKNIAWSWQEEQEESFSRLKEALVQRPLLALYDPNNETILHTDASKHGLGGILLQKDNVSGSIKPVAYFSRKTTVDEQNYHAYELETLAVIASLQRFRVYLLGVRFVLVTDCNAVRATLTKRDLLPRIARWWIAMQEYDFVIQYRSGSTMSHVDALSRNPQPCEADEIPDVMPSILKITEEDWLLSQQLGDTETQRIIKILEDKEYSDIQQNYVVKGNKLYRKVGEEFKWVVPKGARFQICKLNHDEIGHFGIEKTISKIKKDFWFPKMRRFIEKYVKSCIECAYSKEPSGPKEGLLNPIHKVDRPFDTVHVDHLGPFVKSAKGYAYLLVLVDAFTKFCILKPLRNLKTILTVRALEDIFTTFGYPNRLVSDRGTSFTSKEFEKFSNEAKINHILNAVASPRANGQVERYNRTILDALTAYADKLGERYWDTVLGKLQWGLNNTDNKGIGKTPSEALFGITMTNKQENIFSDILKETRQPGVIEDIREKISAHIEKDQKSQKCRYDKHKIKARIYKEGELVKILKPIAHNDGKSKKLLPKFSGPYRVTKVLDNDRYQISSIPGTNLSQKDYCSVWAADRIKPWITINNENSSESSDQSE